MAFTDAENMYNMALGHIGEYRVTEGDTTSKQALLCIRYYEKARNQTIKAHRWNEATESVIICQDATNPTFGYSRRYAKPDDCLRVLSCDDSLGADPSRNFQGIYPWAVKGSWIHSNAGHTPPSWGTGKSYIDGQFFSSSSVTYEVLVTHTSDTVVNDLASNYIVSKGGDYRIVYVDYLKELTALDDMSDEMQLAISLNLASKIVTGLVNDPKAKESLVAEYDKVMREARGVDAQEGKPRPLFSSSWLRARNAGNANSYYVV